MDVGMAEAGQMCDEPMHREEEGRPHQDVFGIDCGLWGSALGRWAWTMMDRDATSDVGRLPGHVAASLGLFGTCDMMLEPQEGQRFAHLVVIMP
jgi:hypothetical protein